LLAAIRNSIAGCVVDYPKADVARTTGGLTALKVDRTKHPDMYADGGGLYLRVTREGTKNWVLRYMLAAAAAWADSYFGIASPRAFPAKRHHAARRLGGALI